jgi:molybdate transport system ATP-binding protein
MTIEVDVKLVLGEFALQARFAGDRGVTALFGPSGAGKTTLGLLLAGLLRPTAGRIALDGTVLTDRSSGIFVPPHRRRIAAVFQDGRLFPHMTVAQNLRYGGWFNRTDPSRFDPVVELLGVRALLKRRPATLSGGEQRRVAIGRALLSDPRLLILDEPLTGLDASRKEEILPYLERLRDELRLPIIYISHALDEIVRLADTLVLID